MDRQKRIELLTKFKEEYEGTDEEFDRVQHRLYQRREIFQAAGCSSTNALSNKIPDIEAIVGEKLGTQYNEKSPYYYTLDEVYKIIDACRQLEQQARKKSKFQVVKKFKNHKAKLVAFVNQKGGASKSTSALHAAMGMALMDLAEAKVLLIDYDPQGNINSFLDGRYTNPYTTKTLFRYLMGEYDHEFEGIDEQKQFLLNEIIRPSHLPNMFYTIALTDDNALEGYLNQLELSLDDEDYSGNEVFKLFKEKFIDLIESEFDYIIADGAPHNNTFIKMLLFAADTVVIPAPCKAMDFESSINFILSMDQFYLDINQELELAEPKDPDLIILPVMFSNNESSRSYYAQYMQLFGDKVYAQYISKKDCYESLSADKQTTYSLPSSEMSKSIREAHSEWESFNNYLRSRTMEK
ncbi:ParA family protein (plasmid) [Vibrio sp. SS-MA-C1-2]|uniref:ParA family protein n=1 Tax=Vibrio sp. SS-MA-C1-2 TaxID=2908646 RepID=UPI001F46AEA7|nr:ParA family protein [Vibrio sp. SS-MA-C1-2]UJF20236.1 ParA family protein [Vibrio sp. SS-MA-C1-2]